MSEGGGHGNGGDGGHGDGGHGGSGFTQRNGAAEVERRRKTCFLGSVSVALLLCIVPLAPSSLFPLSPSAPLAALSSAQQQYPSLPSETPARLVPPTDGFDYVKRDVMIPMRDGVKLHTVVLVPRGARSAPILLTRTPYDASALTSHAESSHLGPVLSGYDNATDVIVDGGYIRVVQDVRGKHGSEGDYIMNRPLQGPQNPTPVDHATDTYDTIDWLVNNIPETNGKVGILGISYDGFLPLMALVNPHPALKVSVPMNPMVDGWMGDDWFHNGAFRQPSFDYVTSMTTNAGDNDAVASGTGDDYVTFLKAGSAGDYARRWGLDSYPFVQKLMQNPAYTDFWSLQAVDKWVAAKPLTVPTMLVVGQWDQEDSYGAPKVYQTLEPKDVDNDKLYFVI